MDQSTVSRPRHAVERNVELTTVVMLELAASPALVEKLPADFRLVLLPEGEPELWLYNLHLLQTESSSGRPVVFARVTNLGAGNQVHTDFYAPLAV